MIRLQKVIERISLTEIENWGCTNDRCVLVVANVVVQKNFVFRTDQGAVITQLLHDYAHIKLESAVKSEATQQLQQQQVQPQKEPTDDTH